MTDRSLKSFMEGWAGACIAMHRILKSFIWRNSDGQIVIKQPMFVDQPARDMLRALFELTELNPISAARMGDVATDFVVDALQEHLKTHHPMELACPEGMVDFAIFFRQYIRTHGQGPKGF